MIPTVNDRVVAMVIAYDGSITAFFEVTVIVLLLRISGIVVDKIACVPSRSTTLPVIRLMTAIAPKMKYSL